LVFNNLKRKVKDLNRFKEILELLFSGELRVLVTDLNLTKHLSHKKKLIIINKNKKPTIIVETLEKLGPTFIKLGQLLSIRPDLVPPEYVEELKKLQDEVPPIPFQAVKDVLQRELKKPLSKVFSSFEEKPLAAASVSQVHLAVLRDSKKKVAVKIQRPGIKEIMRKDIDILEYLSKKIDKTKKYSFINAREIIEEFKEYTKKELNFRVEAHRMKKFYEFYKNKKDTKIIIPKIYEEICTSKVLIMSFIKGTPLTDMNALKKRKADLKELTTIGVDAVLEQIFDLGMFHADAHPGNLLLVRTKTRNGKMIDKLAILDYGIVGTIDDEMKGLFLRILDGLVNNDSEKIVEALLLLGEKKPGFKKEFLKKRVKEIINNWSGSSLEEEKLSSDLYKIISEAGRTGFKVDENIVLLAKGYLVIESTANYLYPELDISDKIQKYFRKHKKLFYKPLIKNAKKGINDFSDFVKKVPIYAENINEMVEKGVKLDIDKKEFNNIISNYDLEMNKRVMATIAGSIFIGSSLLAYLKPEAMIIGMKLYEVGFLLFLTTLVLLIVYSLKTHKYLNK